MKQIPLNTTSDLFDTKQGKSIAMLHNKSLKRLLLCIALFLGVNANAQLLSEGFESVATGCGTSGSSCYNMCLPTGWMTQGGTPFIGTTSLPRTGSKCVGCRYGWTSKMMTSAVSLTAGVTYTFSYYYKNTVGEASAFTMNIGVTAVGAVQCSAVTTLATVNVGTSTSYTLHTVNYPAPTTGTYYFAIWNSNTTFAGTAINVDDVLLTCASPTGGSIAGPTPVCAPSTGSYSVSSVSNTISGVSTYTWSVPSGATITSTNGTTTSTNATVNWGASLSGNQNLICTVSNGSCATATDVITKVVSVTTSPAAPSTPILGSSSICNGSTTTVQATSTSNTINWYTVSSGGTLLGNSASAANFTVSPTTTTSYFAEAKTTAGCLSATRLSVGTITVSNMPTGGAISGPNLICSGAPNQTYSINGVSGTSVTYSWSVPSGSALVDPNNTSSTTMAVNWGSTSGTVNCYPQSGACVRTAIPYSVAFISAPSAPSVISFPSVICSGTTQNYNVTNIAGLTYNWSLTLLPGWSVNPASTTNSINLLSGSSGGTLSVTSTNICGATSSPSTQVLVVSPPPPNTPGPIVQY